ncbi:hypothetical protein OUZ56_009676 [Daphnia magna]|uniref:Uncharacterized protein n=1 Tax=Daphnia magna TaxID=35525 RepID=A0ABR0AGP1_9CRUS|nr:hypothetical protein OUZ56_009676 [Daphnia magna]
MGKQKWEGRKLCNETAQNEERQDDEEGRSKGMGKQKKEGRESDNETVQNEEEDEEGWDKEMKKRRKEGIRRFPDKSYDMATLLLFTVPLQLSSACNLM